MKNKIKNIFKPFLGIPIFWMVGFLLLTNLLFSQRPTNFGQGRSSTTSNQSTEKPSGPDTTIYNYILTENLYRTKPLDDTLANIAFMQNTILPNNSTNMVHSGNLGSAMYPLLYQPFINTGFNSGYNQYNPYQIHLENFRFYEQNRPISDLFFSQLANQENINVKANFSRNFSDGLSLSLNYFRISQKGFFTGQDTKSTAFGIGLRYKDKANKYNSFLMFFHNANEEFHIGGILNPEDLKLTFKQDIGVTLSDAATRQQEQSLAFVQYYTLSAEKNANWRLYIKNDLKYNPSYYKFFDNNISDLNDSTFYWGINLDSRGLRRYTSVRNLSNGFYLNGEKVGGLEGRLGLVLDYFSISDGGDPIKRLDVTATFDGLLPVFKSFKLATNGKLGLGENFGSFMFSGSIDFAYKKAGLFKVHSKIFRSENPYNSYRLIINDIPEISNTFDKPFGTVIGATLDIPTLKLHGSISQSIVNNPIYWDLDGQATQYDGVFSASHVSVGNTFRLGKFHLKSDAHLQYFNDELYPIPTFFSTHQLYYQGSWFSKVMDVTIGLDARLIPDYKGPSFQPLFGTFHISDTSLPFFPASNLFLLARVSSFRAIFMMENFSQYWIKDTNFDVVNHPQFDPKLRFGIRWLLKD